MSSSHTLPRGAVFGDARKCILLVEDEFLIRWMLGEELRAAGYHVIEASNALEALSVIKTIWPDMMISDVQMPGSMDGLDLLARVREIIPSLPVLIMSGHLQPGQAKIDGPTEFLAKPFVFEAAISAARKALGDTR